MIADPFGWNLIAAKRPTGTHLPAPAILWLVMAPTTIQGKSDWTRTFEGRDSQDAFLLTRPSHRLDPVLRTAFIPRRPDKCSLRVWDRIDIADTIVDPVCWDLTSRKGLTETHLPTNPAQRLVIAAATIQGKSDWTLTS